MGILELIGALFGVIGATLVALNIKVSRLGFFAYMVSNVAMIGFGIEAGHVGVIAMNLVFMLTTIIGIVRHCR